MNHWQIEVLAEQRRREIQADMKAIRLAELAGAGIRHQNWFERRMVAFGEWMIAVGKRIRSRYAEPCVHQHVPTSGFAR